MHIYPIFVALIGCSAPSASEYSLFASVQIGERAELVAATPDGVMVDGVFTALDLGHPTRMVGHKEALYVGNEEGWVSEIRFDRNAPYAARLEGGADGPIQSIRILDVDLDGFDDLYAGVGWSFNDSFYARERGETLPSLPNIAWRGTAHGFVFDSTAFGAPDDGMSLGVAFGDLNQDGWPDLVVANDFGTSSLYLNQGGHLEFQPYALGNEIGNGMGVAIADLNKDTLPDIWITQYGRDQVYLNYDGFFFESAAALQIDESITPTIGWDVLVTASNPLTVVVAEGWWEDEPRSSYDPQVTYTTWVMDNDSWSRGLTGPMGLGARQLFWHDERLVVTSPYQDPVFY